MSTTDLSVFFSISLPKNKLTTKQWKKCFVNQAACNSVIRGQKLIKISPMDFGVERRGSMLSLVLVTVFHKLLLSLILNGEGFWLLLTVKMFESFFSSSKGAFETVFCAIDIRYPSGI